MEHEEEPVVDPHTPVESKFRFVHDPQRSTVNFFEDHGLDLDQPYTKSELRAMGWAMYNRVGDGQVPIVKQIDGENTRMDALLTQEQLDRHKKESLPEGVTEAELPNIEADMNKFMSEVQALTYANEALDPDSRVGNGINVHINHFIDDLENRYSDESIISKADEHNLHYGGDGNIVRAAMNLARDKFSIPDNVRGIPISKLARRDEGRGVYGYPCPCTDCEHVFPTQSGIKIFDQDGSITDEPTQQIRMNVVTNHLAGHGINDNENHTVERDHSYMTLRQYMPIYEKKSWDDEHPEVASLDPFAVEQEVLRIVLKDVRGKLGLEGKFSDEELEKTIREYLHLPEPENKNTFKIPEFKKDEEGINEILKNVTVRAKVEAERTTNEENKQKYEHVVDIAVNGKKDQNGNIVEGGWMTQDELTSRVESYFYEQLDKKALLEKQEEAKKEARKLINSITPLIGLVPNIVLEELPFSETRSLYAAKLSIEAIATELKQKWQSIAVEAGASAKMIEILEQIT